MDIKYIGKGPYPDFEQDGTVFNMLGLMVDCADYQADVPTIINIVTDTTGNVKIMSSPPGNQDRYIASLLLPAVKYQSEITQGDNGQEQEIFTSLPLDSAQIKIRLW